MNQRHGFLVNCLLRATSMIRLLRTLASLSTHVSHPGSQRNAVRKTNGDYTQRTAMMSCVAKPELIRERAHVHVVSCKVSARAREKDARGG